MCTVHIDVHCHALLLYACMYMELVTYVKSFLTCTVCMLFVAVYVRTCIVRPCVRSSLRMHLEYIYD